MDLQSGFFEVLLLCSVVIIWIMLILLLYFVIKTRKFKNSGVQESYATTFNIILKSDKSK